MRILLDAHVSDRRVGDPLRRAGHEVRAANEVPELGRMSDEELLAVAAEERRILVSFDVKDFLPLLREWAEAGQSHAGCVLVTGLGHQEFGRLLAGLERLLRERPESESWRDRTVFLTKRA